MQIDGNLWAPYYELDCDWLWHKSWEVMHCPPYSCDLTPSDFHHYELLKKTGANMKQADCRFFTPVYSVEIQALVSRLGRCFCVNWALMGTIC